jgi:hypothetical protein
LRSASAIDSGAGCHWLRLRLLTSLQAFQHRAALNGGPSRDVAPAATVRAVREVNTSVLAGIGCRLTGRCRGVRSLRRKSESICRFIGSG